MVTRGGALGAIPSCDWTVLTPPLTLLRRQLIVGGDFSVERSAGSSQSLLELRPSLRTECGQWLCHGFVVCITLDFS